MKTEQVLVVVTAAAIGAQVVHLPHPSGAEQVAESFVPAIRHDHHTEIEGVEYAIAVRAEREVRPAGIPFDNSSMLTEPIGRPWQTQPTYLGSSLPLMAGWLAGAEAVGPAA